MSKITFDPTINWAFLYGLSDFWSTMFEDPELFGGMYNATTVQMAKAYSKFLGLSSSISLQDILVNTSSESELVLIRQSANDSEGLTFTLSKPIVSCEFICDRPLLPQITLENGVDFELNEVEPGVVQITFSKDIVEFGFPYRETDSGVVEYALWANDCVLDEQLLYKFYAKPLGLTPSNSTNIFKDYVRGLYFLYSQGPNLSFMEQGISLSVGIPVARSEEVVFLTNFDPQTGSWIVVTNRNSYVLPYGIEPSVSRGEVLSTGQLLSSVIEIKDYQNSGDWWLDIYIPPTLLPDTPQGAIASRGSDAEILMRQYLKTHTFLVQITLQEGVTTDTFQTFRDVIDKVKPSYTLGIFSYVLPLGAEEIVEEEILNLQPSVIRDDFLGRQSGMERARDSFYPDGSAKTSRETNRWMMRSNFSTEALNIQNVPNVERVVAPIVVNTTDFIGMTSGYFSNSGSESSQYYTLSGDGFTKSFNLPFSVNTPESLLVFINGSFQHSYEYRLDNNVITFLLTPAAGVNNIELNYLVSGTRVRRTSITTDGISTVYSLPYSLRTRENIMLFDLESLVADNLLKLDYEEVGFGVNTLMDYRFLPESVSQIEDYGFVYDNPAEPSGNNLVFGSPPPPGSDRLEVVYFDVDGPAALTTYSFTSDSSVYSLSATPISKFDCMVFVNGRYVSKNNYNLIGGTLTFSEGVVSRMSDIRIYRVDNICPVYPATFFASRTFNLATKRTLNLDFYPADKADLHIYMAGKYFSPNEYTLDGNVLSIFPMYSYGLIAESVGATKDWGTLIDAVTSREDYGLLEDLFGDVYLYYTPTPRVTNRVIITSSNLPYTFNYTSLNNDGLLVYRNGYLIDQRDVLVSNATVSLASRANILSSDEIQIVVYDPYIPRARTLQFAVNGTQSVFNVNPSAVGIRAFLNGFFLAPTQYSYNAGVVTFNTAPSSGLLQIVEYDYPSMQTLASAAIPLYNAKEYEVRQKLTSAGITPPAQLPERFAIRNYTKDSLFYRTEPPIGLVSGQDYYSTVSSNPYENLLNVDANGQHPETHRSFYRPAAQGTILLFQKVASIVDVWSVFILGGPSQPYQLLIPEEDPLAVYLEAV